MGLRRCVGIFIFAIPSLVLAVQGFLILIFKQKSHSSITEWLTLRLLIFGTSVPFG